MTLQVTLPLGYLWMEKNEGVLYDRNWSWPFYEEHGPRGVAVPFRPTPPDFNLEAARRILHDPSYSRYPGISSLELGWDARDSQTFTYRLWRQEWFDHLAGGHNTACTFLFGPHWPKHDFMRRLELLVELECETWFDGPSLSRSLMKSYGYQGW